VAPSTLGPECVPRWYSVTVAVGCCLWVTVMAAVTHGGAAARGIVGVVSACIAAGLFLVCRVNFRKLLAKPLPRRGLMCWLTAQPVWLMVLAYLAFGFAAPLAVAAVVFSIAHLPVAGFLLGPAPVCVLAAWAQVAAWLELRRRQDARS
jgi:hypothetical protein